MRLPAISILLALSFPALASANCDPGEQVVNFGLANTEENTPVSQFAWELKRKVDQIGDKAVCLKFVVSVGSDADRKLLGTLKLGAVHMAAPSFTSVAAEIPEFGVFDLPFAFTDRLALNAFLAGQGSVYLANAARGYGAKSLVPLVAGFRQLTAKKPVQDPGDAAGLKFWLGSDPFHGGMLPLVNATGQSIAAPKLGDALKNDTVEALSLDWIALSENGSLLVLNGVSETNHSLRGWQVLASLKWWTDVDQKIRTLVTKAVNDAANAFNQAALKRQQDARQNVLQSGKPVRALTRGQRLDWLKVLDPAWAAFRAKAETGKLLKALDRANR